MKHDHKNARERADEAWSKEPPPNSEADYGFVPHGNMRTHPRFTLIPWDDYVYDPAEAENDVVRGLLPAQGVAILYAKWKSFKSFVGLHLAVTVAQGVLWAGRETKKGAVVYVVAEGARGFHKRVDAYKQRDGLKGIAVYIVEARPNLGTKSGDAPKLIADIKVAFDSDKGPSLVIIDTLARTLHGEDENGQGMACFVNNAEEIADAFQCLVLAVHHEGAGDRGRMRGYTAADAASVATLHVTRDNPRSLSCTLEVTEAKDSVSHDRYAIELEVFRFGDEHDECAETTLIVKSVEPVAAAADDRAPVGKSKRRSRPPPLLNRFMTAFDNALRDHGKYIHLPDSGPGARVVEIERVRAAYYDMRPDLDNADSKGAAFRRAMGQAISRENLIAREIAGEKLLWRPDKSDPAEG
jgi:hypothetical protein